jgi:hypothetical protein
MALSRFVVTATVTIPADTLATVVAGEPGTGGAAGNGNSGTMAPGTSGKYGLFGETITAGTVVYADSTAGTTAPQLLYQALNTLSAVRAFVPGQDDKRGGTSN